MESLLVIALAIVALGVAAWAFVLLRSMLRRAPDDGAPRTRPRTTDTD